jgi:8-oxo-dGTP pyrophosphatase MutT (NUDIX family)
MERIQLIRNILSSHPVRIIEPNGRAHASVALILTEQPTALDVLLIRRSTNESDFWSGQLGLPGGRMEASDRSPRHTAERETREEIGLDLATADFLGRLSDTAPGGLKIVISCFVYAVRGFPALTLDNQEIADLFWVPVRELCNPARLTHVDFTVRDRMRRFPALSVADDVGQPLWGITYRLLRNFHKVICSRSDYDHSGSLIDHVKTLIRLETF